MRGSQAAQQKLRCAEALALYENAPIQMILDESLD